MLCCAVVCYIAACAGYARCCTVTTQSVALRGATQHVTTQTGATQRNDTQRNRAQLNPTQKHATQGGAIQSNQLNTIVYLITYCTIV